MPPITSDKEVSVAVQGLIGVNFDILSNYIFIDQWQMFSVFNMPKSDRLSAFQSLYGLDKAEICYDELTKQSSKIILSAPSETVESIVTLLREKQLLLNSINESITQARVSSIDDSELQARLLEVRRQKMLKNDIEKAISELSKLSEDITNCESLKEGLLKQLKSFKDFDNGSSVIADYKNYQVTWSAIKSYDSIRANNLKLLNSLTLELESIEKDRPLIPDNYMAASGDDFNNLTDVVGLLSSKKKCLEQLGDKQECPICGTTGDILISAMDTLKTAISKIEPIASSLSSH